MSKAAIDDTTVSGTGVNTQPAKAALRGLVSKGDESFNTNTAQAPDNSLMEPNTNPDIYTASVVLVTWKQLQPMSTSAIDPTPIDSALAMISKYNRVHPDHPIVGKLRVFAGMNSPDWVMSLDGNPMSAIVDGNPFTLPRFWTTKYAAAWTSLQQLLADRYDGNPLVGEVAVTGCSSVESDPFLTPTNKEKISILRSAGYTDTQMQFCLSGMKTQYGAWKVTPLDFSINLFARLDSGSAVPDSEVSVMLMADWRISLGTRGILSSHELLPAIPPYLAPIYRELGVLGGPLGLSQLDPAEDWNACFAYALTLHPSEVELWPTTGTGEAADITLAMLQRWASEL